MHQSDGIKIGIICLLKPSMCSIGNEILVSFDVSLFTNVPVDEAVSIIRERLRENRTLGDRTSLSLERIADLLEMCLKYTYFSFGGNYLKWRYRSVCVGFL